MDNLSIDLEAITPIHEALFPCEYSCDNQGVRFFSDDKDDVKTMVLLNVGVTKEDLREAAEMIKAKDVNSDMWLSMNNQEMNRFLNEMQSPYTKDAQDKLDMWSNQVVNHSGYMIAARG